MSSLSAPFVHLHCHSAYSLAEGAIKVKDLIKMCVKLKMPAVAVTDTNNMFGAMEFALEAMKNGVQPIMGAQVTWSDEGDQIVLLVQNEEGYRNLCHILSDAYMDSGDSASTVVKAEKLHSHNAGLLCLSGGAKSVLNRHIAHNQGDKAEESLTFLKGIFVDRFYIELQRHGIVGEAAIESALIDLAYKHDVPLVATNDCYFAKRKGYEAHDALLCIAEGRYVTEDDRRKVTREHYFKSPKEMQELFKDIPEAIQNTAVIAQRCSYAIEPINPILPAFDTEEGRSEFDELKAQAEKGLKWRLSLKEKTEAKEKKLAGEPDSSAAEMVASGEEGEVFTEEDYFERLEYELGIIEGMGFPGYFLIVSDFIKWAKAQNIPVGPGRGSGAGSVVAWALQITDLDPLELGLLFERFLNPERVSMPDFDIDFCQERRDEVIRYVQDKYGYDRVAQIITFGKLQARAVVRDVGRVLQMSYGQVDRIAKMIPNNPAHPVTLQEALDGDPDFRREINKDEMQKTLIDIALQLEGLYRHASTHAAGVVIGDRPLEQLVPLYRDPRSTMPVTQFNMKYVEQAGLVKFDFLGLKTMTVVQKTVEMINADEGGKKPDEPIDLLTIPLDDPAAYELMASGNTVGVFQLESAGMRDTLRKVKPNRFEDIIALVSLYRPGPMDNIPKYSAVKEGKEEPDYLHPKLKPYLEETYGIMIYQEQVMQAAQVLAGYTLGGADLLRRAMGKKIQAEMDAQREAFVKGAAEHNDVPKDQASAIFDQIDKFAGYGFNKSHAAAYALIAYWTAWLKAHYPTQFMAASMTLDLGNTDKLSVFKQNLDKMKIPLLPPDINKSEPLFTVEGEAVRYALGALKGVGEAAMSALVQEREESGVFASLEDFAGRLETKHMNKRQFESLVNAGAFDSLNNNRAQLSAGTDIVLRYAHSLAEERESGQVSLFGGGDDSGSSGLGMPDLPKVDPWGHLERLAHEFKAVGFYLSAHPLDAKLEQFQTLGISTFAELEETMQNASASRFQVAGVLLKKQQKISQRGNKYAFLQLSDPTGIFEVTAFSDILFAAQDYLDVGAMLLLKVEAEQSDEQLRLTVQSIQPLDDAVEHKIRNIDIRLNSAESIGKLKEFLDIEAEGDARGLAKITLYVDLGDNREGILELPDMCRLSAQARDLMRNQAGITDIKER